MPQGGAGKGGGKDSGGKTTAGRGKTARLGPNVAPPGTVPAHMARRVESGSVALKGTWRRWPGLEES
jgi:hypothetical protein